MLVELVSEGGEGGGGGGVKMGSRGAAVLERGGGGCLGWVGGWMVVRIVFG